VVTRAKSDSVCEGGSYTLPWGQIASTGGTYIDTLRSSAGCDSLMDSVTIVLLPRPAVGVTKSNDINCPTRVAQLTATGGIAYQWSPTTLLNNPTVYNPLAAPATTTTYHVTVTASNGCTQQDSIEVKVLADGSGYQLPSAFTPNNDGVNDCFGVFTWGAVTNFSLAVYNRLGNQVFKTTDPGVCWDGTFKGLRQPSGTYVYMVNAQTVCGKLFRKGTVVLIR
jgi:gliding motility-associated-like protein